MQFELPRRHRKSFEVTTRKKLSEKFNKSESLEVFEVIKKEYKNSPPTFGSSSGKKGVLTGTSYYYGQPNSKRV